MLSSRKKLNYFDELQERDFIHVSDVSSAFISIINNLNRESCFFKNYDIGTGKTHSIKYVVKFVDNYLNSNKEINFDKKNTFNLNPIKLSADLRQIKLLKWKPLIDLDDGLIQLIKNEKQNKF